MIRDLLSPGYYQRRTLAGDEMQAHDVIEGWDLSYHVGTEVAYCLRAGKKTRDPRQDIAKALKHLQRELLRLEAKR